MSFIKDILPIFKKHELSYERRYNELNDIYTFVFRSDRNINWKSGQHGVFTVVHEKIKNPTRPFSIASTENDGYIEISTRVGENPSEFKQALMHLKPGMKINMRGPIGGFYIRNNKPTLLIAGGIGITPFKSIVKDFIEGSHMGSEKLHLLYIDTKSEFIYQKEFNNAAENNHFIVEYINNKDDLSKSIKSFIQEHKNQANYFIVGAPQMTKSVSTLLKNYGIKKKDITRDTFIGY